MSIPEKKANSHQDEIGASIDDTGKGAEKDAVKDGNWKQRAVHDLPQDEQMHDEFGKGGEPVPPGEGN